MPENKKYFWIKLKATFFQSKEIKKLRRTAGGDTFVIIYLKMQLLSLETGGKLYYEGIEDDFADELALALDEDPDNVRMTLAFLQNYHLIEQNSDEEYTLPEAIENTGKEGASAKRMRELRQRRIGENETKASHCDASVTPLLQSSDALVTKRDTEIEKETEKELYLESDFYACASAHTREGGRPTQAEVKEYCQLINAKVNPAYFWNHYEENEWKDSRGLPISDWKAILNRWDQGERNRAQEQPPEEPKKSNVDKYKFVINDF